MALSDLRVSGLEHYGGVDLKRNYRKFFSEGIVVSIGLHLLVLLLYITYNFLTIEPTYIYPYWRTNSILVTIPPPSIVSDDPLPPPSAVTSRPPALNDIPVPVPDLVEPVNVEPTRATSSHVEPGTTHVGEPGTTNTTSPIHIEPSRSTSDIPDIGDWVDVSEEPRPIYDVQTLVEYPRNAQRTGIEGTLAIAALIGEDGRVLKVEVLKRDHPWLEQSAIDAMMKMRFTPAKQGETLVKIWYTQTIKFKLSN